MFLSPSGDRPSKVVPDGTNFICALSQSGRYFFISHTDAMASRSGERWVTIVFIKIYLLFLLRKAALFLFHSFSYTQSSPRFFLKLQVESEYRSDRRRQIFLRR